MTNQIKKPNADPILPPDQNKESRDVLRNEVIDLSLIACNILDRTESAIVGNRTKSEHYLQALEAKGGLQEMLAAQMMSVHQLQQVSIRMAVDADFPSAKHYFTNTAIKLANTFVQQATLLSKLQGHGEQKIIVEHVDVHNGGQAIVGNINNTAPSERAKK